MMHLLPANRLINARQTPLIAASLILAALLLLSGPLQLWSNMQLNGRPALVLGIVVLLFAPMLGRHVACGGTTVLLQPLANRALLFLVGWAGLSLVGELLQGGRGTNFALAEWSRLASGAAIYFAALHWSRWGLCRNLACGLV